MLLQQRRMALGGVRALGQHQATNGRCLQAHSVVRAARPGPVAVRVHACANCHNHEEDPSAHPPQSGEAHLDPRSPAPPPKAPGHKAKATGTPANKKAGSPGASRKGASCRAAPVEGDQGNIPEDAVNQAPAQEPAEPSPAEGQMLAARVLSESFLACFQTKLDDYIDTSCSHPSATDDDRWVGVLEEVQALLEAEAAAAGLQVTACRRLGDGVWGSLTEEELALGVSILYVYAEDASGCQHHFKCGYTSMPLKDQMRQHNTGRDHMARVVAAWKVAPLPGVHAVGSQASGLAPAQGFKDSNSSTSGANGLGNNVVPFCWEPEEQQQPSERRLELLAEYLRTHEEVEWQQARAALLRVAAACAASGGLHAVCCSHEDGTFDDLTEKEKEAGATMVYIYTSQETSLQGQFKVGWTRGTIGERLGGWDTQCGHDPKLLVAWKIYPFPGMRFAKGDWREKIHAGWWLEQLLHAALGHPIKRYSYGLLWAEKPKCAKCNRAHEEWFCVCHPATGVNLLTDEGLFLHNNRGLEARLSDLKATKAQLNKEQQERAMADELCNSDIMSRLGASWLYLCCVLGGVPLDEPMPPAIPVRC